MGADHEEGGLTASEGAAGRHFGGQYAVGRRAPAFAASLSGVLQQGPTGGPRRPTFHRAHAEERGAASVDDDGMD